MGGTVGEGTHVSEEGEERGRQRTGGEARESRGKGAVLPNLLLDLGFLGGKETGTVVVKERVKERVAGADGWN